MEFFLTSYPNMESPTLPPCNIQHKTHLPSVCEPTYLFALIGYSYHPVHFYSGKHPYQFSALCENTDKDKLQP